MSEGIVNHMHHPLYQPLGIFLFSLEQFFKKQKVFPVISLFLNVTEWETFKLIFPQHHDHVFIFNMHCCDECSPPPPLPLVLGRS